MSIQRHFIVDNINLPQENNYTLLRTIYPKGDSWMKFKFFAYKHLASCIKKTAVLLKIYSVRFKIQYL